jgi:hypothetical protein
VFGKVFVQIFESSIAEDREVRWVFMDLLVLADQNGVVDMTMQAVARRTNVPIEIVSRAIGVLESPDPQSRSPEFCGARLTRLDPAREWGWVINNYTKYRAIANAEAYREVSKEKVRAMREMTGNGDPQAASKFRKPEYPEMELYASKIGLPVTEINPFFDYYESNGWRVGKNPMKDWQAAMRNWKKNYDTRRFQNSNSWSRTPTTANPRNDGVARAGADFAAAAAQKQIRQGNAGVR